MDCQQKLISFPCIRWHHHPFSACQANTSMYLNLIFICSLRWHRGLFLNVQSQINVPSQYIYVLKPHICSLIWHRWLFLNVQSQPMCQANTSMCLNLISMGSLRWHRWLFLNVQSQPMCQANTSMCLNLIFMCSLRWHRGLFLNVQSQPIGILTALQ